MCIIFYNETGIEYDRKEISTAYDNNPHGVGLMWIEDGAVQTLRGLYSKEKLFKILKNFVGVPHALHLRWRTRGKIELDACHPFRASHKDSKQSVYLMHNGTIFGQVAEKNESDTSAFARSLRAVTKKYGTDVLFHDVFLDKVEKQIQAFNKVVFMKDDGKVAILNRNEWTIKNGLWYSNTYSLIEDYRKKKETEELRALARISATVSKATNTIQTSGNGDWFSKSQAWEQSRDKDKDKKQDDERKLLLGKQSEELSGKSSKEKSKKEKRKERRLIRRRRDENGEIYSETVTLLR